MIFRRFLPYIELILLIGVKSRKCPCLIYLVCIVPVGFHSLRQAPLFHKDIFFPCRRVRYRHGSVRHCRLLGRGRGGQAEEAAVRQIARRWRTGL